MREKLHWAAIFDVAGRKWSVLCVPAPSFFEAEGSRQSWFILIIGFLITGMASSYLLSDIGRTAQIERLVEKRTLELSRVNRDLEREIHEHEQTEAKLRESERRFADLFESAPDPILRINAQGYFEAINPAAEKAIGMKKEDLIGKHFVEMGKVSPEAIEKATSEFRAIMSGEDRPPAEYEITTDGVTRLYEANPRVIEQKGKIIGLQIIFRDITLRRHREELEIKSQFISTVSHELRTPLHTIKEGINVILDGSTGDVNEEQREFLQIAKRNVDRLARLINNVLDFQKWESGEMVLFPAEYSINDVVREVEKTMFGLVRNKNLKLELDLAENLPRATFDRDRVIQVLVNLVDNAIKFTKKGAVTISTRMKEDPRAIQVSVQDSGIGIKKEDVPKLFKDFSQLGRTRSASARGTGLGLVISKRIIEQHGGKIWVESQD